MLLFSLSFFCVLIGFNGGEVRFIFIISAVGAIFVYYFTLHKLAKDMLLRIKRNNKNKNHQNL